jgi:hypothetical protein
METNEAAKTLGRLGGIVKSERKLESGRANAQNAREAKGYKAENEVLRERINKMRSYILAHSNDEKALDVAGDAA